MSEVRFPQWRNANDRVKYPFDDSTSLESSAGVLIPDNLFIDARLYPIGGTARQFLSSVVKAGSLLSFYISSSSGTALASGSYNVSAPPSRHVIVLKDSLNRSAGVLVTDSTRISPLAGWADGTYAFTSDQTEFAAGTIVPMPDYGVRSIRVDDTESLSGNAYIVGGRGVVLSVSGNTISVNIVGEAKYKQLLCSVDGFEYPCPVKTINGLRPDEFGNFMIVPCGIDADHGPIRVIPVEHGIKINVAGGKAE